MIKMIIKDDCIFNSIGFIPHKTPSFPQFERWSMIYADDIENIFRIFQSQLKNIIPTNKNIIEKELFRHSSKYLENG